jgi:hypothetical protein
VQISSEADDVEKKPELEDSSRDDETERFESFLASAEAK